MKPESANFNGAKILVVEDNPINQIVTQENLNKLGCTVELASSGKEALDKFTPGSFDCILMDVQMPNMDGYETTRQIRSKEQDDNHVTIIALTANAMPEDRQKCLDSGMNDYIAKPIEANTLADCLRKYL